MVLREKVLKVNEFILLLIINIAIKLNLLIVLIAVVTIALLVYRIGTLDTVSLSAVFIHKGIS
jgi:hypothetical protein